MVKTAIITGASRGIGKAIAEELADNYNLILLSRHYNEVKAVSDELKQNKFRLCLPYECDISNSKQAKKTFEGIYNKFGSIDILVNNAGTNSRKTLTGKLETWFEDFEDNLQGWNEEINTNLTGAYICSYLASGYMLKNKNTSSIINISSVKAKEPTSSPGYGASKAGVIKLTRDFAKALAPKIRVNCIAPGFIDTGMTYELPEEKKTAYKKLIPLGRFGALEEVAKVVSFLASDNASYITGAVIDVNGGYLMS